MSVMLDISCLSHKVEAHSRCDTGVSRLAQFVQKNYYI